MISQPYLFGLALGAVTTWLFYRFIPGSFACRWKHDQFHGYFDTACGNAYCFEYDFTTTESYKFCPGCGKYITLK